MSCPDKNCREDMREDMEQFRKTLYGVDGNGGIVACMKNKLSKKSAWIFLVVIGIPLFVTGVKVWSGQDTDPLRYASRGEVNDIDKRLCILESNLNNILTTLNNINTTQNTLIEIQTTMKSDIAILKQKKHLDD